MVERALKVEGLAHQYDDIDVLGGVELTLGPGVFAAVLGPSGCGKSTLLRAVAGLVQPTAGRITIGEDVVFEDGRVRVPADRRRVGLVFQDYALFPHMTVLDNVRFGLAGRSDADRRAREMLALVGLPDIAGRLPGALSGGQQQRVALARALAPEPRLLLLDEPFANVDPAQRAELGAELVRVVTEARTSALLVTHDREDALGLAQRVVVLERREGGAVVVQDAAPEVVYSQPATRVSAALTGRVWLLDGDAAGDTAACALGEVRLRAPRTGPVTLAVRPEQLVFVQQDDGDSVVVQRRFAAPGWRLRCRTPAGSCVVAVGQTGAPRVGARGGIRISGAVWALP